MSRCIFIPNLGTSKSLKNIQLAEIGRERGEAQVSLVSLSCGSGKLGLGKREMQNLLSEESPEGSIRAAPRATSHSLVVAPVPRDPSYPLPSSGS